jgi:hypothetical protein
VQYYLTDPSLLILAAMERNRRELRALLLLLVGFLFMANTGFRPVSELSPAQGASLIFSNLFFSAATLYFFASRELSRRLDYVQYYRTEELKEQYEADTAQLKLNI